MSELNILAIIIAIASLGYTLYQQVKAPKKADKTLKEELPTLEPGEAETRAKEIILNAKDEALRIKNEAENDLQEVRRSIQKNEERLLTREEKLEEKIERLHQQEKEIETLAQTKQRELDETKRIKQQQIEKLETLAALSKKEAEDLMLNRVEENLQQEIGKRIKEADEKVREEVDLRVKQILVDNMFHAATDYVAEYTTSIVKLPDEEMKGRIIGKEGRNIKAFERITGVNVDLDENPGEIRLSCFDPIRREVAKITLEKLIKDGRIQPARIEEISKKTEQELEAIMYKEGESLCQAVNVYNLPREIVKLLGKFKYRYSYGQNMIQHTLEETKLGLKLAKEIGADANVVRLACLLHDIGKVIDDNEGTHVELGVDLLKKFQLPAKVISCVAEHHEDESFSSLESVLVYVADAISASRPGARHEDYDAYVKRLEDLEKVATSFPGIEKAYAISAGREIRVVVEPEKVDDLSAYKLAHDIAQKIERELVYPGQVKVTVVREVRAEEIAR